MTELLSDKINALRNIVQSLKIERFQHELMLEDVAETTGNETADAALQQQAETSKSVIASCTRRIAVRMKRLEALETEKKQSDDKALKDAADAAAKEPVLKEKP